MTISLNNNKRIAKNTMLLYIRMILTMLVSLYTSRVVLNTLGVNDFGTYNVVGGVVTMLTFFNGAMAAATQRFLSYEIGLNDMVQLRKTFNAAQNIHIIIAILVFVLAETLGIWFLKTYINIPDTRIGAVYWMYHFSVLTFLITIIQVPYNSLLIARERFSVYAYMSIVEVIMKFGIVFMLVWIAFDKLILYALLLLVVSTIIAIIYRIYSLKNFEETQFVVVKDITLYKTLINYTGWNLFGGVAAISKVQGVSIILNLFFGTVVNAAHGVANQVSSSVNMFVYNFQIASNPQIIKSYAKSDINYMSNLVIRTSKFSFYMLLILTLPIIIEIEFVLKTWLKTVPDFTAIFTILVLINSLVDSVSGPLMTSLHATGKIKTYQLLVGILMFTSLPLSYFLFYIGYFPHYIFLVGIILSFISLLLRLILVKKKIPEFYITTFVEEIIIRNVFIIILSSILPLLVLFSMDYGVLRFIFTFFLSILSCLVFIYFIGLNNSEKLYIKTSIKNFLKLKK